MQISPYCYRFHHDVPVILGIPISAAVFGDPALGKQFGILAAASSFIFQLPLQLFFLECHALKQSEMEVETHDTRQPETERDLEDCGNDNLEKDEEPCEMSPPVLPRAPSSPEGNVESSISSRNLFWHQEIWGKISNQVVRNPVLWAIGLGFIVTLSTLGPRFLNPTSNDFIPGLGWIVLTLTWFGECVSPVSLFTMGVWMQKQRRSMFGIPWWSASLFMLSKLVIVPLVMVFLAKAVNLDNKSGRAAVLIAALPISLATFVLASRYKIGEGILSENVALGTILILPTIILWNIVLDELNVFPIPEPSV
jgi:predicted permease